MERAAKDHGDAGQRAAEFLRRHRPSFDAKLDAELLLENLEFALRARREFSWCAALSESRFHNDVLPYAVLDERRDPWRREFYEIAKSIVADCKSASEAAQALNAEFFDRIEVHYDTGRSKPNQSPREAMVEKKATCTGLSILLVDACRAVGIPARVAGIALWPNKRGNHNWVEVWDSGWHYTGADEYSKEGLNRAWFAADASRAIAGEWKHAIWATSWRKTENHFPLVWNLECHEVPAVNVTSRYVKEDSAPAPEIATVSFRCFETVGGERLALPVEVFTVSGELVHSFTTKAGRADLNDMPSVELTPGRQYALRMRRGDQVRWQSLRPTPGAITVSLIWAELSSRSIALQAVNEWLLLLPEERHLSVPEHVLSRSEATSVVEKTWEVLRQEWVRERGLGETLKRVTHGDREMKILERRFGRAEVGQRSLWISLHGGGGAPARVNDQQWRNQITLYEPEEGFVVAPRAPTNTWNLWHEAPIDDLLQTLIESYVVARGVDPNRVYLLGYSAGGDGVYQLAPRLADRFAAAAMMAGHPNDASPLGLRNLPFAIFMGGKDASYKRNEVAKQWGERLESLRKADPTGYPHWVQIYPDHGHWMDGEDREALPWMAKSVRKPWPKRVVWHQSSRTHERFYWLATTKPAARSTITATVEAQRIDVTTETKAGTRMPTVEVILRLSDQLLDLDRPVVVFLDGEQVHDGKVSRSVSAIHRSLLERADPASVATALLTIRR